MPRGDGRGPMGAGSMTGKAQGDCAESSGRYPVESIPGFAWQGGRGRVGGGKGQGQGGGRCRGRHFGGFGSGRGRGFGVGAAVPVQANPEQEIASLQERAEYLRQAQEEISRRMEAFKAGRKE